MFKIVITIVAEADIDEAFEWWREHRSREQADRWYRGIVPAIQSLSQSADRRPRAKEADRLGVDIREFYFGIGLKPTHRVIFIIEHDAVKVLRVRHLSRGSLQLSDL